MRVREYILYAFIYSVRVYEFSHPNIHSLHDENMSYIRMRENIFVY